MAHITGGGLPGNVARIIPEGLRAHLLVEPARIDPIFTLLQKMGNVPVEDMYSTFNMGAGFVLVVEASDEEAILKRLAKLGENAFPLGSIEETAKGPKVLLSAPPLPGTPLF